MSIDSAAAEAASDVSPVAPHPTGGMLFITTHPLVVEKDKSIHSEHGIIHYPFYFGGLASCVSNICTQPLGVPPTPDVRSLEASWWDVEDLYRSMAHGGCSWAVERRMRATFHYCCATADLVQLSASLTRTVIQSGIRFGMYEKLKEMASTPTHAPSAVHLAALAAVSGVTGSLSSNFADIVTLRMQNDPGLPLEQRRNYNNIAHGVVKMIRTEGWNSIWTGAHIGAGRAAVATATQLAGYDVVKRELLKRTSMRDDVPAHITASCMAGFLSTFLCSPLDVFKARIMAGRTNQPILVMLKQIFKNEGPVWMFRGLTPALVSRGPATIITFVTFEQMKRVYREANGFDE